MIWRKLDEPVAAQTTRVYMWSRNLLKHSGMTHALINNTVSILLLELNYVIFPLMLNASLLSLSLSSTISNRSILKA